MLEHGTESGGEYAGRGWVYPLEGFAGVASAGVQPAYTEITAPGNAEVPDEHPELVQTPEATKAPMEATEDGGISFGSKAAAALVARGLERMASGFTFGDDRRIAKEFRTMRDKALAYANAGDSDGAGAVDTAAAQEPLKFTPDNDMGAEELEWVVSKAIRFSVDGYGSADAPDAALASEMFKSYELSKLTPEMRTFYGIDGPDPDPDRIAYALLDQRQQADEARARRTRYGY